jgi:hypothetical protein
VRGVTDALDRRAAILVAASGIAIVFNAATGAGFLVQPSTWKVSLFVASLAGLVAALALSVLAFAPEHPRAAVLPRRDILLFWAAVAFVVALALTALVAAVSAVDALGGDEFELNG